MFMPDGSGVDFIATARRTRPGARIVAITGGGSWEGFDVLLEAKDAGADVTLRKPVPADVIADAVEGLLA
jgi:DNA-binding NarL/FixJ family response regulator